MLRALHFTETATGVTYTARTSVPKGARILDVLVETTVAWTAATAPVDVGDSDAADALIAAYDLVSVVYEAADQASPGTAWGDASGNGAPYSSGGTGKVYPSGDLITAVVSPTVPGGPTGISAIYLLIELPPAVSNPATVV